MLVYFPHCLNLYQSIIISDQHFVRNVKSERIIQHLKKPIRNKSIYAFNDMFCQLPKQSIDLGDKHMLLDNIKSWQIFENLCKYTKIFFWTFIFMYCYEELLTLQPYPVCSIKFQTLHVINTFSQRICTRSKLSTSMSQLQIPTKGLRKRRKKTAQNETSDILTDIKHIATTRRGIEDQARTNGMRVQKDARVRPRPFCCTCRGQPGVKRDG